MPLRIIDLDKRNLKQEYLEHLVLPSGFATKDDPFQKSFHEIYTKLNSALAELISTHSDPHKPSPQKYRIDGENYEILKSFILSSVKNVTYSPYNKESVDTFLTKIEGSLEAYYDIFNGEAGASSLAEKITNLIITKAREFILTEIARDHALLTRELKISAASTSPHQSSDLEEDQQAAAKEKTLKQDLILSISELKGEVEGSI